jgi:hypothetical protein
VLQTRCRGAAVRHRHLWLLYHVDFLLVSDVRILT